MAVKLRLKRIGRRKRPFYRIVAIDSRTRRDGAEIERLGWFDPLRTDVAVELQEDRIIHWLNQGAQPSETVNNILKEMGLKYKIHLMREGKSEEKITSLLAEWQLRQEENRAIQLEKKEAKKLAAIKAKEAATAEVASAAEKEEPLDPKPVKEDSQVEKVQSTVEDTAIEEASSEDPVEEVSADDSVMEVSEEEAPAEEESAEIIDAFEESKKPKVQAEVEDIDPESTDKRISGKKKNLKKHQKKKVHRLNTTSK